jgi:predicted secreted protein
VTIAGALVVFFLSWFVILLMVLPWGIKTPEEADEGRHLGTAESAPVKPRLLLKFAITTLLSIVVLLIVWGIISSGLITIEPLRPGGAG